MEVLRFGNVVKIVVGRSLTELVWLMYIDPVQLTDDQRNHIPLRTTWLKLGQPLTNENYARAVLAYGLKIDSNIPTPINFAFGPVDQIGKTIAISVPLVEAWESNGKDTAVLLRLECQDLPVR